MFVQSVVVRVFVCVSTLVQRLHDSLMARSDRKMITNALTGMILLLLLCNHITLDENALGNIDNDRQTTHNKKIE